MKKKWVFALLSLALVFGVGVCPAAAEEKPHSLLLIGDSNIEFGPIANGYAEILGSSFGSGGSGYIPLNATYVNLAASGVSLTADAGWVAGDMNINGRHSSGTVYAPGGLWTECETKGAVYTVTCKGSGIDLYYTAMPGGGRFGVELDGENKGETDTAAQRAETRKLSFTGLDADKTHTLKITLVSGRVILTGVDRVQGTGARAVVHNWGNGSADTTDFIRVEENVLRSAVKALDPDAVVILLGTNDVLSSDEKEFADNLTAFVQRVQKATDAPVMIMSHFRIFREYSVTKDYLSYSYPAVRDRTGCTYWNMYAWYGDGVATLKDSSDGVHCNAAAGKRIAAELYAQVKAMREPQPATTAPTKAPASTTKPVNTTKPAHTTKPAGTTAQAAPVSTDTAATGDTTAADTPETSATDAGETKATVPASAETKAPEESKPQTEKGGFPVWGIVLIVAAVLAAGGTAAVMIVRKKKTDNG